jgi:hypothetical protein
MKTNVPAFRLVFDRVIATPLRELGCRRTKALLGEAIAAREGGILFALWGLSMDSPRPAAERKVKRLRGKSKDAGPLRYLEDVAAKAERLAPLLARPPFRGRAVRFPPTEDGALRHCAEELTAALATIRFWCDLLLAEEQAARVTVKHNARTGGIRADEIAAFVAEVVTRLVPGTNPELVDSWALGIAAELRPDVKPDSLRRQAERAREGLATGKRPRLAHAVALALFGDVRTSHPQS